MDFEKCCSWPTVLQLFIHQCQHPPDLFPGCRVDVSHPFFVDLREIQIAGVADRRGQPSGEVPQGLPIIEQGGPAPADLPQNHRTTKGSIRIPQNHWLLWLAVGFWWNEELPVARGRTLWSWGTSSYSPHRHDYITESLYIIYIYCI